MKDVNFNALLIASKPKKYSTNKVFTDRVMKAVEASEILSSSIRKMDVNKKETLIMKFRHLPKFAIIAIAIGALLVVSTGAYAAYQLLWPKSEVTISEPITSNNGRQEVKLAFSQCGDTHLADRYELKRNATIKADQISGVVKAQCELKAIDSWAQVTFPNDNALERPNKVDYTKPYDITHITTSMATHLKSTNGSSVTFTGLTKYAQADEITFNNVKNVRYIADGVDTTADKITTSDPVVYITSEKMHSTPDPGCKETRCSTSGNTVSSDLVAIVKLTMPFENYDQFAWQSLTEKLVCMGNKEDTCLSGSIGSIDLYMNTNLSNVGGIMKEIQGVITKIDGTSVEIQASSGNLFTIKSSTDIVGDYNTERSAGYNNQKVKVGSSLIVRYYEKEAEHSKLITTNNLFSMGFLLEMVGKADAPNGY